MSYVSTRTMIPIARVAAHLGLDFYHFFQQEAKPDHPVVSSCDDDFYQYDWQSSGKLSRESLAFALREAEDIVCGHLHWTPVQQWFEEDHDVTQYYRTELGSFFNAQGRAKSVKADWGFVTETGRRKSTYLDTPAINWFDLDGDGLFETGEITVATTATDETELHLYYPSKNGEDEWEIRPLTSVVIAAGVATIRFPRYLVPLEDLIERPVGDDPHILIDALDDTQYLDEVDVYWVYTDTTEQGLFLYESDLSCNTTPCAGTSESVCLSIRDSRLGILAYNRADYNATTGAFELAEYTNYPDKIRIYYRAGWKDPHRKYSKVQIDQSLERLIIFYALSLLDTRLSGCDNTRNIWQYMTQNLTLRTGDKSYNLPWGLGDNPLQPPTQAAILLWKYIQGKRIQSFSMP